VQFPLQHNCLWKLPPARYEVLVSDPAVWWATLAAAVIMKAMDGKCCWIVFVACAHVEWGRQRLRRHGGEEDFHPQQRSSTGLVCVTIMSPSCFFDLWRVVYCRACAKPEGSLRRGSVGPSYSTPASLVPCVQKLSD
jgi:hypothetical protein